MQDDLAWLVYRFAGLKWWALAVALLCHAGAVTLHVLAWRTILAHEYGRANVRLRSVFGGYVAGSALNAFVPRAGVVLKLLIVKNHVKGASYPAVVSTLVVLAAFDVVVTTAIVVWAVRASLLPDPHDLAEYQALVGSFAIDHPVATAVGGALAASLLVVLVLVLHRRMRGFGSEFGRGLRVLAYPGFYLTRVVPIQAVNWVAQLAALAFFLTAFNLPPTPRNVLLVQAAKSLAVLVPFTPSGAGAQFALLMLAFNRHFSALTISGLAIGMRLATTVFNVAVGGAAIFLTLGTLRWRTAFRAEPAPQAVRARAHRGPTRRARSP